MAKGKLDDAKTQWYHVRAIIISGMGFFTDAYDLICITMIARLLGRLYYTQPGALKPGILPINASALVNGISLCGTMIGQLFFGWLGDHMGRKKVYGITLIILIFSSIASGISFGQTSNKGILTTLCFFRFWLGFGVGGEYPLSATIMSEYANKKTRGTFIAAVYAMQGMGILAGGIVSLLVSAAFENKYKSPPFNVNALASTPRQADYLWRIILMIGAIPAAITYYYRMLMPETPNYTTTLVTENNNCKQQAVDDMSKVLNVDVEAEEEEKDDENSVRIKAFESGLFSSEFASRYGLRLLGTTSTWFLLDIAYYSQNLFQKDLYFSVGWIPPPSELSGIREVYMIAKVSTLIALCGTVPGYWFCVVFIDVIGRWRIQMMGFFFMTVFMFSTAIPYDYWNTKENRIGFLILYGLTFFFANFGPNVTTFVVPAEIFPARLRSTCHGISAASGKAGAIIGAFGFLYACQETDPQKRHHNYPGGIGKKKSLIILGVINFFGMLCTFLVPEPMGKSLEELSGEVDDEIDNTESQLKVVA